MSVKELKRITKKTVKFLATHSFKEDSFIEALIFSCEEILNTNLVSLRADVTEADLRGVDLTNVVLSGVGKLVWRC